MTEHANEDETGLGLIELIVAMLVSTIVLVGVAMVFVNSWKIQEQVTSVTEATNRGQLVGSTIERAMRNALFFEVSESGTVLRVRTSLAGNLKCQGFRLTDGSAQMTTASTALNVANTTWPQWQKAIAKQGSTAYFVRNANSTLTYTFKITTKAAPVNFGSDTPPRSIQEMGSDGCW